jgi:RNA polymerase sigma factor for flagellar operon FliA
MAQLPRPRAAQTLPVVAALTVGDESGQSGVTGPKPAADELVRQTMPLVGYIVTELISRLPAHIRREDLESAGYEALVRCAKSYDPAVGTSFAQYARIRVRGAVVDELRSADWASRGTRRAERRLTGAEDTLTQQLGRRPSPAELAEHLGEDGNDLVRTRERVQRAAVLSLNALVGDSDVDLATNLPSEDLGQEDQVLAGERAHVLHAAVQALPERLRQVVTDYFLGEKPMTEIAAEMGVSESRISQMRAQALELLREGLNRHLEGAESEPAPEAGVAARRREEYYARVAALSGVAGRFDAAPVERTTYVSAMA